MSLQALVIDLLGQGYEEKEVVAVSGLTGEEVRAVAREFADQILEKRVEATVVRRQADREMDEIELALLEKMKVLANFSNNLTEITRAFVAMNSAKRKTADNGAKETGATYVPVTLPQTLVQNNITFVTDTSNRVTEVNGRPMTSANNKQVHNLIDQLELAASQAALAPVAAQEELAKALVEVVYEHQQHESLTLEDFTPTPAR